MKKIKMRRAWCGRKTGKYERKTITRIEIRHCFTPLMYEESWRYFVSCFNSLSIQIDWNFLLRPRERLRSIAMSVCLCVCLSVCLSARISPETHAQPLPNFLCMLPMSVARSSSGKLTIGRIAYRRERGDRSAQRGRSVIYDCLVYNCYT